MEIILAFLIIGVVAWCIHRLVDGKPIIPGRDNSGGGDRPLPDHPIVEQEQMNAVSITEEPVLLVEEPAPKPKRTRKKAVETNTDAAK